MKTWIFALTWTALGAGCGNSNLSKIDGTAHFDGSVTNTALATVGQLRIVVSGDENDEYTTELSSAASRDEHFDFDPIADARDIAIQVTAETAGGATVASGTSPNITIDSVGTKSVTITLTAPTAPDGASPDGGT